MVFSVVVFLRRDVIIAEHKFPEFCLKKRGADWRGQTSPIWTVEGNGEWRMKPDGEVLTRREDVANGANSNNLTLFRG